MHQYKDVRKEIAYFMRRLYKQGLTTSSGGNISFRVDGDRVLITPSQTDKGRMKASEIGMTDMQGNPLSPQHKLSMETGMHLAVYQARPEVTAIVHAHPVTATSFAVAHQTIDCSLMGEARAIIGEPILAPYALMGSPGLANTVAEAIKKAQVVLMENHGVLAVGNTLLEAFDRLEVLEACARVNILTKMIGNAVGLSPKELAAIDQMMQK